MFTHPHVHNSMQCKLSDMEVLSYHIYITFAKREGSHLQLRGGLSQHVCVTRWLHQLSNGPDKQCIQVKWKNIMCDDTNKPHTQLLYTTVETVRWEVTEKFLYILHCILFRREQENKDTQEGKWMQKRTGISYCLQTSSNQALRKSPSGPIVPTPNE